MKLLHEYIKTLLMEVPLDDFEYVTPTKKDEPVIIKDELADYFKDIPQMVNVYVAHTDDLNWAQQVPSAMSGKLPDHMNNRGITQIADVGGVAKLYPQLAKEFDGSAINLLYVYPKTYLTSDEFVADVNPHYIAHDLHHIFELQNRKRRVGGLGEDKFKKIIKGYLDELLLATLGPHSDEYKAVSRSLGRIGRRFGVDKAEGRRLYSEIFPGYDFVSGDPDLLGDAFAAYLKSGKKIQLGIPTSWKGETGERKTVDRDIKIRNDAVSQAVASEWSKDLQDLLDTLMEPLVGKVGIFNVFGVGGKDKERAIESGKGAGRKKYPELFGYFDSHGAKFESFRDYDERGKALVVEFPHPAPGEDVWKVEEYASYKPDVVAKLDDLGFDVVEASTGFGFDREGINLYLMPKVMKETMVRECIRILLEQSQPTRTPLDLFIPSDLAKLHQVFKDAGLELFVVGGAVRDTLLNKSPKDYDLVTGASPETVIDIVSKDPGSKVDLTGKSFGVVRVNTEDGNEYEIATFRKDIGSGRRPDAVEFTSIEDDVKRRDLTINALFYDMDTGEVVDYVGGIDDIKSGTVKAVGDPMQRFQEDKLRILRAARFAARLGSDLDPETEAAILSDNDLTEVSPDRIRDEVVKGITAAQNVGHFLELLRNLDLYDQIFPGLQVDQNTGANTKDVTVQLALMLSTNDPDQVKSVLKSMKYSNDEVAAVIFLMKFPEIAKDSAPAMKKEFNRIKMDPGRLQEFSQSANISQKTVDSFLKFASAPPAVNPRDLMSQGLKGPEIGMAMQAAESDAYDQALEELREYIGILLEFECPERDAHGWGQYYEVNVDDVLPTVQEVLDCWVQNGAKMYERSMPLMYSPKELLPYREYERNRLRNNVKSEYYQGLKQSIADEGIRESLHITVGLNGIAKISEGNHRHEIAAELGLQAVPVTFHFYQEVQLTPPREAAIEKKIDDEFLKDDFDEDSIPYEERSPEEQVEIDRGVVEIMKSLGW